MEIKEFLRTHWPRIAIALTLIIGISLFLQFFIIPQYTPQSAYFRQYPVDVFLEVEEPLPVETVKLLALLSFESLNETFGYRISLAGVSTFSDDGIWNYSDEILDGVLWGNRVGGSHSLRWSVKGGSMRMTIKAFTGEGPHRDYFEVPGGALGISNYGDKIGLFFNETGDDLTHQNMLRNIKTYLHEFGHAFGLKHNLTSPMMYSPEVDPDKIGEPSWPSSFRASSNSGVVYPYPEGTVEEALNDFNIYSISSNPIWHYHESQMMYFNFSSPKEWAPNSPNCTGFVNQSHLWCFMGEYSVNLTVVWMDRTIVDTEVGYYWHNYSLEWCTINLGGFEAFWTEEELRECRGG
ncbi:MAG: hypothetical protein R6W91_01010 [Thermoplasmata archaeon]